MKTAFFGTPALAVPFLELLADKTQLAVAVTNPDEPAGRGYELQSSPVKQAAQQRGIPVLQPTSAKDPAFLSAFQSHGADVVIVVAYGKILPVDLLKIPRQGFLNVHFSLLPAYRGAAPIQRALMNGEKETGITLFWLDEGMDTGPIFLQKKQVIEPEDDSESLRQKLVELGLKGLTEAVDKIERKDIVRTPQSGAPSLAPSLKKEEGKIDWNMPAGTLINLIRGTAHWPGAYTFVQTTGKSLRLKVLKAHFLEHIPASGNPVAGQVVHLDKDKGLVVKCGQGFLQLLHVQPEGKRAMSAWDFWQGARLKLGEKLG